MSVRYFSKLFIRSALLGWALVVGGGSFFIPKHALASPESCTSLLKTHQLKGHQEAVRVHTEYKAPSMAIDTAQALAENEHLSPRVVFGLLGHSLKTDSILFWHLDQLWAEDWANIKASPRWRSLKQEDGPKSNAFSRLNALIRLSKTRAQARSFRHSQKDLRRLQLMIDNLGEEHLAAQNQDGHTLLHWATLLGHNNGKKSNTIINTLIGYEMALKGGRNKWGQSALHFAVISGHKQTLELLLRQNLSLFNDTPDDKGLTALHYAILNRDLDMVKSFVQALGCAPYEAPSSFNKKRAPHKKSQQVRAQRYFEVYPYTSPLKLAFDMGSFDAAEYLLSCYSPQHLMRLHKKGEKWVFRYLQKVVHSSVKLK